MVNNISDNEMIHDKHLIPDEAAMLAEILDGTADEVFLFNPELRIIWANRSARERFRTNFRDETIIGKSCPEVIGDCVPGISHDSDDSDYTAIKCGHECRDKRGGSIFCPLQVVRETGESCKAFEERTSENGDLIIHEISAYPSRISDSLIYISRDITKAWSIETELMEIRNQFFLLQENSIDILMILDSNFNFSFISSAVSESVGLLPEELMGRNLVELIHSDSVNMVSERITSVIRDQLSGKKIDEAMHWEVKLKDSRSEPVWSEIVVKKSQERPGMKSCYVAVSRSINQRKIYEHALIRAQQEWADTFDAVPDLIALLDRNQNILRMNRAMAESFRSLNEIPGRKKCFQMVHGTSCAIENCPHMKALQDGKTHVSEVRLDKLGKDLLVSVTPLMDRKSNVIGSVHVARDITVQKTTQRELKKVEMDLRNTLDELSTKSESLQLANSELSQYAYAVTHDVRAPLRAIHNYALFLREDLQDSLSDDTLLYMNNLVKAVIEAEELVNGILELSKIGFEDLILKPLEIKSFIGELTEGLNLETDCEITIIGPEFEILGEATLLRQIFQNLVLNGLKFNNSAIRRVEIHCDETAVADEITEGFARIRVQDNGIGMDERYFEQVFRVFERLHSNNEYPGTGIGLSIVKKAVTRLGGKIEISSQPGEGTCFTVLLRKYDAD
ncbi:MAG: hypothetical protein CVV64_19405 [Candidatus Wallbacteria bacterium HGW-Wallbacteria-1]|jgi:PAS domain S-box-containing protein|uniref:histidine kinase n=1 Tax=Candidatus Wallbacteria bacterium HGW-Wallbacteria-1 TaxID=2013854 RepID=A0A2N1PJ27_9BACT|nr:MAG: hypothetical protein CVV64_19405 [Candidatus Wallbacteria bacterium HGW-Wallbacteria-1]